MNRSRRLIAGLLFCIVACSHNAMARDINVVHSGSWPPYAGENLPAQGLAIELVTTALQRAGYSPRVTTASLTEILKGTRTGVYDVFATPWYSAERDQYLAFSQPYLESSIHFIKRRDTPFDYTRFDDLEGMTVGVVTNYAYEEDFQQSAAIEKVSAPGLTDNLRKLIGGEIDLAVDDERVLIYTINRLMPQSAEQLEVLAKPLVTRGINIGVSRSNPDHAKIVAGFDEAIATMKNDGSYDRIVQKHKAYIEQPSD